MSSEQDDIASYSAGTKNASDKWLRKFKAKAQTAVTKLQDPKTADAWQAAVTQDSAKKAYTAKAKTLSVTDLTAPAEQRGKSNYSTSTGAASTVQKWATRSAPYRQAAKDFSASKKPAITQQDKIDNMVGNMENMQKVKTQQMGA